jgi:tetratricopeptide (TPR) repeat protein
VASGPRRRRHRRTARRRIGPRTVSEYEHRESAASPGRRRHGPAANSNPGGATLPDLAPAYDVFLSYNSEDRLIVRRIAEGLRDRRLRVWLDDWELIPGRPWQEILEDIIETVGAAAVFVGPDGLGPWEVSEMRGCLAQLVKRKLPVVPVLLPGCPKAPDLPLFLGGVTWVDLRDGVTEEGLDRLEWGITGRKPLSLAASLPPADEATLLIPRSEKTAPPPAAGTFAPGELLAGRFRVVRFLGHGGMGDVYEAEDEEVHGRVALKTVRAEIARQPGILERFGREIHLARKVTHPNVCRIFDISHHGDVTFLTMELLPGETLEHRLKRDGAMREAEALPIARQMADGLAAAHKAGVVHRDFKPANVMLVPEDGGERAVVMDFGLAHGAGPAAAGGLTVRGDILGTPSYMAPEQVAGEAVTPATDVYALGITLYEMVTGALPFVGETALSTAVKRLREEPEPPRLKAPALDPAWNAAILRCLAREPKHRFSGVRDAVAALTAEEPPTVAMSLPDATQRRRLLAAVAALGILLGIAGGAKLLIDRRSAVDPLAYDLPPELAAVGSLPASAEARDFYLKGREALGKFDAAKARDLLQNAIAAEPGFPLSHAALAEAWERLGYSGRAAEEAKRSVDLAAAADSPRAERELLQARYWEIVKRWDRAVESYRALRSSSPENLSYGLGLARALTRVGRGQEALEITKGLKSVSAEDPRVDLYEAEASGSLSQFDRQREAAIRARDKAEALGLRRLVAGALMVEGAARRSQQDHDGALEAYGRAHDIYVDSGDLRNLALVASSKAAVLYDQGKLEEARQGFTEARETYVKVQDRGGEAGELNNLAGVLSSGGQYAEASRLYEQAAKVLREIGDWDGEAQALGNLGFVLGLQGDLAAGVRRIEEALTAYESMGSRLGQATQLLNLGTLYQNTSDLGRARSSFERALKLAEPTGNQSLAAQISANLGLVLTTQGELDGAYEKLQRAVETQTRLREEGRAAASRLALAEVLLEQGLPRQGIPFAEKAAEACRALADAGCEVQAAVLLARLQAASGDLRKARADLDRAEGMAKEIGDPWLSANVALAAGRVLAAEGKPAAAVKRLAAAIEESRQAGISDMDLYLRLALGEIEAAHGDRGRGLERLRAVQADAKRQGVGLIANKAARALAP